MSHQQKQAKRQKGKKAKRQTIHTEGVFWEED